MGEGTVWRDNQPKLGESLRDEIKRLRRERDEALDWIRVVGEETESGGDRNMTLAKIRYLLRLLPYSDHTYHCGVKAGEKCDCGFNTVLQPNIPVERP